MARHHHSGQLYGFCGCMSRGLALRAAAAAVVLGWPHVGASRLRRKPAEAGGFIYNYHQRGKDWIQGQCPVGEKQSPIDLPAPGPPAGEFQFDYGDAPMAYDIVHTGHGISVELIGVPEGGIMFNNVWYPLLNMNLHVMSEHTFAGVAKPAELHLVHKRHDTGDLLVVAVALDAPGMIGAPAPAPGLGPSPAPGPAPAPAPGLVLLGENRSQQAPPAASAAAPAAPAGLAVAPLARALPLETDAGFNPTLQALFMAPAPPDNERMKVPLGVARTLALNLLFEGASFFRYWGSTTTPPCAEAVTWLVRTTPVPMSEEQAKFMQETMLKITEGFGNSRGVQPFGSRAPVAVLSAVRQVLDHSPKPGFMLHTEPPTEREIRARLQTESANSVAKDAVKKIKDLEAYAKKAAAMDAAAFR
eukprot:TRINITY_DN122747_c0_g1_i1.p1 TRINITY_DN122747_c0_g1~~TRINITY_DN122747_c0_g1_i1.p1  ORF type:complete len:416 (-),score=107.96 TRINITY_DN122747_c0_g1_i1:77-1324(-)